jgi:hypothetical protein
MRYPLLPVLLAAGLAAMAAVSTPSMARTNLWPVEIFDVMDNQKLVLFLRNEDIVSSPSWQPTDGAPPLTIAEALQHIHAWIEKDPRLTGAKVHELELKPIHDHQQSNRWYYLLQLLTERDGKPVTSYAAVLMSGKVVAAIAEPSSFK